LALSAEPYKDDKIAKLNVKKLTGGIIYTIEEKELEQRKVLAQNKVLLIINEYTNNGDNTYRDTYDEVIINNKNRNRLVAGVLELCKLLDIKILALFASKKHGYIIEKKTGVKFLSGDSSGEERETVKEYFLKGKGKQLLASWIWKKGITLPEVQVLLNVDGGKEKSLVIQIRGRVLGMAEGKSRALFVDFIDIYGDYFSEHALERIKVYEEKVGKDNIDVLESGSLDFYEMLESYMMDWFNIKSNDKGRV
jgi:superfamily II DNA or RNA helicase